MKVARAAFALACFWGLSDFHGCLGHLQMAAYHLDKQTTSCNSPHDWLMSFPMDLAALCDMYVVVKMAPMDAIWLLLVKIKPLSAT